MNPENKKQKSKTTRRRFVQAGAAAAGVSLTGQARAAKSETLAVSGGSRTVTFPKKEHYEASHWPRYGPDDKKLVLEILDLNSGACYRELARFEKDWKEYFKAPFVKTHCNGTSALTSMFFALDFPPGSEILVPTYTFFSTCSAMRFFGCVPIFVDIKPNTACFDLDYAAKVMTKRTKAILPMHSWGLPCEMDAIRDFAEKHGLVLLEDAAHAHGASMKDKRTGKWELMGNWGDMSIFSFQATKPLPALEGGMGMYKKREYYERAASFGHYKVPPTLPKDSPYHKYHGTGLGLKFRIHPLAAALGRTQLAKLDERNAKGVAQVRRLNDRICQLPGLSEPVCRSDQKRVYYSQNLLFLDEAKAGFTKQALLKALKAEGVWKGWGDYPLQHKYALYHEAKWWHHKPDVPKELPGAEEVNRRSVTLPYFTRDVPELIDQYIVAFEKVWSHRKQLAKL